MEHMYTQKPLPSKRESMLKNSLSGLFCCYFKPWEIQTIHVTTEAKFYVRFLATVDDEVDDVDDDCLLLYSQVALLADFKSVLSGLNFAALGLASFTVNIEPKLLNPILPQNVVSFLRAMLSTPPSDALGCGGTGTTILAKIFQTDCSVSVK